jgi:cytoskeletal protein CcmA (bactofilin family)
MRAKYIILLMLMLSVLTANGVRAEEAQSAQSKVIERGTQVNGDVVASTGDLIIRGRISGSAIANSGNIILESSGWVEGDVVARQGRIIISPGARICGNMVQGHASTPKVSRDKDTSGVKIRAKEGP